MAALLSPSPYELRRAIVACEEAGFDKDVIAAAKCRFFDAQAEIPFPCARWQFDASGGAWLDYTCESAAELEYHHQAFLASGQKVLPSTVVISSHCAYEVSFVDMAQRNIRSGRSRKIRRLEPAAPHQLFPSPQHWAGLPGREADVTVDLARRFQDMLLSTCHDHTAEFPDSPCAKYRSMRIRRIARIQNPMLWQLYCVKRWTIARELGPRPAKPLQPPVDPSLHVGSVDPSINELFVLHGTKRNVVSTIIEEGFDERVSTGMYGQGLYFSPQSCKVLQYTDVDDDGLRCFFVVRVVLGSIHYVTQADGSLRRPPKALHGGANHSVVANAGKMGLRGQQFHQELILFDGDQAYPEFLIEVGGEPS
eukprot:TRINITY_DN38381_c0_g1_i1.p1 TRINITY_DN38381_c0_g1~~TRINITY_DN38381_c0_g1_i1.p1  ORF type:complete len:408 (-),score=58.82 TRINITY_DN38381_c0_g1_i1:192-1286(-)